MTIRRLLLSIPFVDHAVACRGRHRTLCTRTVISFILIASAQRVVAQDSNPLKPLDTASPRATLQSFYQQAEEIDQYYHAYRENQTNDAFGQLLFALRRTQSLFDVSEVPPANRLEVAGASVTLLYDILLRLPAPSMEDVPGGANFNAAQGPEKWTFPDTELHIVRIEEGDREGEYLFAHDTVARLPQFHALIIHHPPVQPTDIINWREEQIRITGPLFPFAISEWVPDWARLTILGTPIWKITLTLLVAVGISFLTLLWGRLIRKRAAQTGPVRSLAWRLTKPAVLAGLVYAVHTYVMVVQVNLSGRFAEAENVIVSVALFLAAAWAAWLGIFLIIELIIASPNIPEESYDAHLLRLIGRVFAFLAGAAILVLGASQVGIPAVGLLAGVGVGGFALALAAQSTVENLFAGVSLFADRPFRVGDFIHYRGDDGVVEAIGPRSSRLRGLDGTLTTVPNADLAKMHITNYSMRDKCFFHHVLGLRYETTPGQLEWILQELREQIAAHPMVENVPGMPRIRLIGFGASSVEIDVRAYILTTSFSEFLEIQEALMLKIMHLVETAGSGFAFPSTTAYLGRDKGLDVEKSKRAERLARKRSSVSAEHADGQEGPEADDEK